ncbi:LEAF RUST 10 DISEASE-RESISTANCE LOCUS RECEPTOR-LIKE PROTEIN KINASE-like 1.2 [Sesamum indicum]|uniref:non-specific serine/threonine protein kinase n=1 Tax=Sesamum indicum TaxID=4182 RepID=A0A6I9SU17_SESIN|nr:LEAF RUST 10 DISEASE-RESISTANCE LOCUS RECEPTOR-LIKE PROTEIN KINASE-like 1.2 [Sesamum indicum]
MYNRHTFLVCLDICVLCVILLSKRSCGSDYRYEACVPRNCGNGPNISFPFSIPGLQEPYCGYPGFTLNCSQQGFPVLQLPENEYVVQDISYQTRTLRVYDAAVWNSYATGCFPGIRNTTLPTSTFGFSGNVTRLRLFSNCTNSSPENLWRHRVGCDGNGRDRWDLAIYDKDENFTNIALKNCERNVVAPVEDDGNSGPGNVDEVLRRGFVLNWTASDCSKCEKSGGRCGFNATIYHFRCFCPGRPHSRRCRPEKRNESVLILATAISGGGAVLLLCLLISFVLWHCKKRIKKVHFLSRNTSSDPSSKSDIETGRSYFGIPIFSYTELEVATGNFDASKELGDGGFGAVYHGKLQDGREVAIKRLYEHNYRRVEQFMNEIKILTCLRHKNLVSLYGCTSRRSKELLLVYEYIPNGTVADHLHGEKAQKAPLSWPVRMNIAIETASALAYLHKSDIIHRDVKTDNILLDNNFCVKVADFGLSRLCPNNVTHVSTAPQGTPGYVDPEYHQCYQLTDKSDVYSFGVVLVELLSSMPAVDISRSRDEINLANLAVNRILKHAFDELLDPSLGYDYDAEVKRMSTSVAELAFRCLQLEKEMRPSMDEVLSVLEEIRSGEESKFEDVREGSDHNCVSGKMWSETDDVVLLKNMNFESSPNAVTDVWVSSSTITSSVG